MDYPPLSPPTDKKKMHSNVYHVGHGKRAHVKDGRDGLDRRLKHHPCSFNDVDGELLDSLLTLCMLMV